MSITQTYDSKQDRDGALASGVVTDYFSVNV
jgi:hypothetical protein